MKRTGEVVLGVIGALVYGFFAMIGAFMVWLENNSDTLREIVDDAAEQSAGVEFGDFDELVQMMGSSGWALVVMATIAIILGIIAMVLLKGNKQPKIAGILFLATGTIVTVVSFGLGIFGGIFYVIAGIMCFARKEKTVIE